ncbi:hypothetical protein TNCV_2491471 [Trichonephila clavipes]|nr:hypothetical protein TNCV_2491471 [Trichonephila clavipes]
MHGCLLMYSVCVEENTLNIHLAANPHVKLVEREESFPSRWTEYIPNVARPLELSTCCPVACCLWEVLITPSDIRAPGNIPTSWDASRRTATAGSDVVQSGRPIFDDFFQHLWPYIGNNTANVVFQMVKSLWFIRIDQ